MLQESNQPMEFGLSIEREVVGISISMLGLFRAKSNMRQ